MSLLKWRNTRQQWFKPSPKIDVSKDWDQHSNNRSITEARGYRWNLWNINRKRQQAKAAYDKHAKPLPELQVGEPVRLQPVNPKAPWEKGSCLAKVGPLSFLIETESRNLSRWNHKFIRQDPSQDQASSDISSTNPPSQTSPDAGSPAKSLPDAKADSPVEQAPTVRQTHEKSTAVEEIVTFWRAPLPRKMFT